MTTGVKIAIISGVTVLLGGIAVVLYFTVFKKNYKKEVLDWMITDSPKDRNEMSDIMDKMTTQELKDTWTLFDNRINNKGKITDSALKSRIEAISKKYNIFT